MTGIAAPPAERLREVALTPAEYDVIVSRLGRAPNAVELGMLGVLWSEHCSYKTSRPFLAQLPSSGGRVLQGPGENAGAVEIGEGWAVVFKIESHNHPSAIEPYQGAATGVGGILRDVIAMGARPVALLDSLRFGPLPASRALFEGVVAGVGGYGNCIGVPTVGGEIYFDDCYAANPLVNVMCVGVVRAENLKRARAEGAGNKLMLVGAATGRDGIHGASFASVDLDALSSERRPAVQVGNPFLEKCLLEACLELEESDAVVAVQDLGAAGLTSAVAEAAARGAASAQIDVARVPRREREMTAYEVMLSESQERMLIVVRAGHESDVAATFAKWDLEAAVIGEVTETGRLDVFDGLVPVAALPVDLLTEGAPVRRLESRPGAAAVAAPKLATEIRTPGDCLLRLLGSPNLGSRRSVFRRYDHMVGGATVLGPGGDAAVVRVRGTRLGLALTTDGNGRYCSLDPYLGAQIAVAEAARNLVATGAMPLAVTDCLNLANPDRPEVYWQLERVVAGIADACRTLGLPVVSGNVSLYNEEAGAGGIHPTPVIGAVGLLEDYRTRLEAGFRREGDFVLLVGASGDDLGGSEYLTVIEGATGEHPPQLDLGAAISVNQFVLSAAAAGMLASAHDVAEGGLLVALAECCLASGIGVRCPPLAEHSGLSLTGAFFGESQSRFVVSVGPRAMPEIQSLARRLEVEVLVLGMAGGDALEFEGQLRVSLEQMRLAFEGALA